ncbi:histidine kinase dimerization/phosphoacceptor domain -containing protein [Azospirillum sp. SYSU D00513]|uniref:histidine kinase dimerization/phosphoacceptor domain -containing protein n=1 Tax=Azospirillum sp. SYSU D00513 TaxID=2812561 RepID=UPI001A97A26F|nr:histidine kinase dimerization/phosphoacceptor domain -containing protein [Azospirillum sp. SYSU D00513]
MDENSIDSESARALVRQRMDRNPLDDDACAREPIHLPGAVQAHGALLAVDPESGTDGGLIVACSANTAEFLGAAPDALLGRPARAVLTPALVEAVLADWRRGILPETDPTRFHLPPSPGAAAEECWVHRSGGLILVEVETVPPPPPRGAACAHQFAARAAMGLRESATLTDMADRLVGAVRALTGFERVLVYRFDADWNGAAIAEDLAEDWPQPFLHLHFPASDIPRQARALYERNLIRFVRDRDAAGVPLLPVPGRPAAPIDLSGARLRALSPVHMEYQRNIGVDGSMSVSILSDGKLWGLLVAHHRRPHAIHPDIGLAVATLVNAFALRLDTVVHGEAREERQRQLHNYACLLEQAAGPEGLVPALAEGEMTLADQFGACGAALVLDGTVHGVGAVPPAGLVAALAARIRAEMGQRTLFATDHAAALLPDLAGQAERAAGVLAVRLGQEAGMILWFRPEVTQSISWAGDPRKPVVETGGPDAAAPALPRRSFERWIEDRRGYALPWRDWELEIADNLRHAITKVILRHDQRVRELNEKIDRIEGLRAEQAAAQAALKVALSDRNALLAQKETLLRDVDHRVKNSLQLIGALLQLQASQVPKGDVRDQFMEASRRLATVAQVHQRLYQTGELRSVELGQYLRGLCADLSESLRHDVQEALTVEAPTIELPTDQIVRLGLIVNELVTNAFKHARSGGKRPEIAVRFEEGPGEDFRLTVQDNGEGLPDGFDPTRTGGLGMRIVGSLASQFGSRLAWDSEGNGTRFSITIPRDRLMKE